MQSMPNLKEESYLVCLAARLRRLNHSQLPHECSHHLLPLLLPGSSKPTERSTGLRACACVTSTALTPAAKTSYSHADRTAIVVSAVAETVTRIARLTTTATSVVITAAASTGLSERPARRASRADQTATDSSQGAKDSTEQSRR